MGKTAMISTIGRTRISRCRTGGQGTCERSRVRARLARLALALSCGTSVLLGATDGGDGSAHAALEYALNTGGTAGSLGGIFGIGSGISNLLGNTVGLLGNPVVGTTVGLVAGAGILALDGISSGPPGGGGFNQNPNRGNPQPQPPRDVRIVQTLGIGAIQLAFNPQVQQSIFRLFEGIAAVPPGAGSTPSDPVPAADTLADGTKLLAANGQQAAVTYVDPDPASGYGYVSLYGPPFASVVVPPGQGDDTFDLLGDNLQTVLTSGVPFSFPNFTDRFVIDGVNVAGPNFVTGLTFASDGPVLIAQIPLGAFAADVLEPGTLALIGPGLLGLGAAARRRRAAR